MNLREMMDAYSEEGLTRDLAAARVCQDIVLKGYFFWHTLQRSGCTDDKARYGHQRMWNRLCYRS